jgi:hypothetical protein
MAHKISQDTCKLARIPTLIKKYILYTYLAKRLL